MYESESVCMYRVAIAVLLYEDILSTLMHEFTPMHIYVGPKV